MTPFWKENLVDDGLLRRNCLSMLSLGRIYPGRIEYIWNPKQQ